MEHLTRNGPIRTGSFFCKIMLHILLNLCKKLYKYIYKI